MNAIKILTDSLSILETGGVAKRKFKDGEKHCTLGAMLQTTGVSPTTQGISMLAVFIKEFMDAANAVCDAMIGQHDENALTTLNRVTAWNDSHEPREVLAAVRIARDALIVKAILDGSAPLPYELPAASRELASA